MVHDRPVAAIIGDIITSRELPAGRRAETQRELEGYLAWINRHYRDAVAAQFLVTLGDEFQGRLRDPSVIPDIVQDARERLGAEKGDVRLRIAIGWGALTTPLKKVALGTDGPAWHHARAVLNNWRLAKRDGAAFQGFPEDTVLNALSGLMTRHWNALEATQRRTITALRHHEGLRKEAAAELGVTPQALSNRAASAGEREYANGMQALRELLGRT